VFPQYVYSGLWASSAGWVIFGEAEKNAGVSPVAVTAQLSAIISKHHQHGERSHESNQDKQLLNEATQPL